METALKQKHDRLARLFKSVWSKQLNLENGLKAQSKTDFTVKEQFDILGKMLFFAFFFFFLSF